MAKFDHLIRQIEDKVGEINTSVENGCRAHNYTNQQFDTIVGALKSVINELDGVLTYVDQ